MCCYKELNRLKIKKPGPKSKKVVIKKNFQLNFLTSGKLFLTKIHVVDYIN